MNVISKLFPSHCEEKLFFKPKVVESLFKPLISKWLVSKIRKAALSIAIVACAGFPAASYASVNPGCPPPACMSFPVDSGVINVKNYGAVGDGLHDDTQAILSAIRASDNNFGTAWWHNRIIYMPPGTYLISDTLNKRAADGHFMSGMVLIGASPLYTRILLKDNASGYGNNLAPKALVFTSSMLLSGSPTAGGKDYAGKGEGNDAYANYVENMTIDVGHGNPGAIAIDYLANNIGSLRNLNIVAPPGSGATAISMDRKWPGPALVSNVNVSGFDTGISVSNTEYGVTFDKVTLANQRTVALRNNSNSLSINDMAITGDAVGIQNVDPKGLITAVNLRFSGNSPSTERIQNTGVMTLRQVQAAAPSTFFGTVLATGITFEGVYQGNVRLSTATPPWALAIKPAPTVAPAEPPSAWANVQSYGAVADGVTDSSNAIRQAVNSGATTIYFPYGSYVVNDTVDIPSTVRRIEGMDSTISVSRYNSVPFFLGGGILKVSRSGDPLLIERLNFDMTNKGGKLAIQYDGAATLVVRDVVAAGISLINRAVTGGELYLENYSGAAVTLAGPSGAWFHQFNSEAAGARITNNGSPLWISGIKTEQNATVVSNNAGAVTEVLGGLIYMVNPPGTPTPAFRNNGGRLFAAYVEEAFVASATYSVYLLDQTPGYPRTVPASSEIQRGVGRTVPSLTTIGP